MMRRLIAAGLDSIPGGGAEVLSNRVRNIIGIAKGSTEDWIEVMEVAQQQGLKTTATMMFGHVETLEERIDHLLHLRALQDRTQGFTAFIAWTFQPENTAMCGLSTDGRVYCWGEDREGMLGNGPNNGSYDVPVAVVSDGVLEGAVVTDLGAGAGAVWAVTEQAP